ncbi:MAG: HAMP domain-containing sensor histidine kinase [Deltaproteobacteria bacterium]
MKLRTKLVLRGAIAPAFFLAGAIVAGGILFERSLMSSLDESLRAQASVESVSLFDHHEPHLHLPREPLFPTGEPSPTSRALYLADGSKLAGLDQGVDVLDRISLDLIAKTPLLRTRRQASGVEVRELFVSVRAPSGEDYVLWTAHSLEPLQRTVGTYVRTVGGVGLFALLVLAWTQTLFAAQLAARIRNLGRHMTRLMAGDLTSRPPEDDATDEVGDLRASIARATEKLEQARLGQERLVADAAHELRTPLAALRANLDVTLRRERSAEELREACEEMREEVDRLGTLATTLLELARGRHADWMMSPRNVATLLADTIESQRGEAQNKHIEVLLDVPPAVEALCDGEVMRQAFDNLLANAIKFAPRDSRVTVSARDDGECWRLAFEDDGPGVPQDEREAIFEPFRRLNAEHDGTGLGLAIVRNIVERHGGRVFVAPSEVGATFVVTLPKAA